MKKSEIAVEDDGNDKSVGGDNADRLPKITVVDIGLTTDFRRFGRKHNPDHPVHQKKQRPWYRRFDKSK